MIDEQELAGRLQRAAEGWNETMEQLAQSGHLPRRVRKTPPECPECSRPVVAVVQGDRYQLKIPQDAAVQTCYSQESDMVWLHLRPGVGGDSSE